jgi:serine/threonine protein kinase
MRVPEDAREKPPPLPTPEPGSGMRELGTIDDKYLLLREIGSGSAATVYEAEHLIVGKHVALKVLHTPSSTDEVMRERFVGEARAAAQIGHANVVDIYDLGVSNRGVPYLVMELLHGETLEQILKRRGTVPPAEASEIMTQVLAGLGAAHGLGIVHRDLKPANIIVTYPRPDAPLVKVLDFGIAKGVLGGSAQDDEGLVGTPVYMAPEQALTGDVDQRADVYAAGVILYEMLAGEPPFSGTTAEVVSKVIAGKFKDVGAVNPALPRLLTLAITRAMSKDLGARIATAHEFARHLVPYLSRPPPHSVPAGSPSADAFLLVSNQNQDIRIVNSGARSPLPRDFPSMHLARVDGKPRGEPLEDSVLKSPVIPRAPTAPKILMSGGDVETWSDAPAPQPKSGPASSRRFGAVDVLFQSRAPADSGRRSKPVSPWRIAAWATLLGVGIGALIAWLYHLTLGTS